ncbi:MAG: tRNA uridine-5-carboxymethylaminomethyl(34) synthesis GTPase MnmE, partial [Bombilactobacillus sp.]
IHQTDDVIEKLGIKKSQEMMQQADLVLLVLDGSRDLSKEEAQLLQATNNQKRLVIINKADLPQKIDQSLLPPDIIRISALKGDGFTDLKQRIETMFLAGIENSNGAVLLANARQLGLLNQAQKALQSVLTGLNSDIPLDIVLIDFNEAWKKLGEIIGENAPDELVNELFSRFCVGK